ncbi:hypothetical protein Peur_057097 [Populus x canadensis]
MQYEKGMVQEANWQLYKKQRAADAVLYDKMKEAEAQQATGDAAFYAAYKNMFQEIAAINAQAVHGLQPEINIWNSGGAAAGVADGVK